MVDPTAGVIYGRRGLPVGVVKRCGYVRVHRRNTFHAWVHRLVWVAVHGEVPDGMQINHINGIKTDNRLANLELVTPSENNLHAYRIGLKSAVGERNGRAVLTLDDVRAIRSSSDTARTLAALYGVSPYTIRDVRTGRRWKEVA